MAASADELCAVAVRAWRSWIGGPPVLTRAQLDAARARLGFASWEHVHAAARARTPFHPLSGEWVLSSDARKLAYLRWCELTGQWYPRPL